MRIAIPTIENKVALRIRRAEGLLILDVVEGRVTSTESVGCPIRDEFDLVRVLQAYQVETLICGRMTLEQERAVQSLDIFVVHSAPCSVEDVIRTLTGAYATISLSRAAA